MAEPRPPRRAKLAAGALAPALARWEILDQGLRLPVRGPEPCRGAQGPPVEAPAGELFSLWGKFFDAVIFILLFLCLSLYNSLPYVHFSFLRLKRTLEQAQPSMAKRLKAGAASRGMG